MTTQPPALVEFAYGPHLFSQSFLVQTIGLETGLGMIGYAEVFPAPPIRLLSHLFEGVAAIRGGGVVVEAALEVGMLEQFGEGVFLRSLNFTHPLSQSGWDELKPEGPENVLLGMSLDALAALTTQNFRNLFSKAQRY